MSASSSQDHSELLNCFGITSSPPPFICQLPALVENTSKHHAKHSRSIWDQTLQKTPVTCRSTLCANLVGHVEAELSCPTSHVMVLQRRWSGSVIVTKYQAPFHLLLCYVQHLSELSFRIMKKHYSNHRCTGSPAPTPCHAMQCNPIGTTITATFLRFTQSLSRQERPIWQRSSSTASEAFSTTPVPRLLSAF